MKKEFVIKSFENIDASRIDFGNITMKEYLDKGVFKNGDSIIVYDLKESLDNVLSEGEFWVTIYNESMSVECILDASYCINMIGKDFMERMMN